MDDFVGALEAAVGEEEVEEAEVFVVGVVRGAFDCCLGVGEGADEVFYGHFFGCCSGFGFLARVCIFVFECLIVHGLAHTHKRVRALSEQELGCHIHCERIEQWLQIDLISRWYAINQSLTMLFEVGLYVFNTTAREAWPYHLSRMLPGFAVCSEDTFAEELPEVLLSMDWERPGKEVSRKYGLNVGGFDGALN